MKLLYNVIFFVLIATVGYSATVVTPMPFNQRANGGKHWRLDTGLVIGDNENLKYYSDTYYNYQTNPFKNDDGYNISGNLYMHGGLHVKPLYQISASGANIGAFSYPYSRTKIKDGDFSAYRWASLYYQTKEFSQSYGTVDYDHINRVDTKFQIYANEGCRYSNQSPISELGIGTNQYSAGVYNGKLILRSDLYASGYSMSTGTIIDGEGYATFNGTIKSSELKVTSINNSLYYPYDNRYISITIPLNVITGNLTGNLYIVTINSNYITSNTNYTTSNGSIIIPTGNYQYTFSCHNSYSTSKPDILYYLINNDINPSDCTGNAIFYTSATNSSYTSISSSGILNNISKLTLGFKSFFGTPTQWVRQYWLTLILRRI
jgi:hypothetical protein